MGVEGLSSAILTYMLLWCWAGGLNIKLYSQVQYTHASKLAIQLLQLFIILFSLLVCSGMSFLIKWRMWHLMFHTWCVLATMRVIQKIQSTSKTYVAAMLYCYWFCCDLLLSVHSTKVMTQEGSAMFHISTAMPCQDLVQTNHGKGVYKCVSICFCHLCVCMCIMEVRRSSGMYIYVCVHLAVSNVGVGIITENYLILPLGWLCLSEWGNPYGQLYMYM